MIINNKTFKEWTVDDLRSLINNEDFEKINLLIISGHLTFWKL